MLRSGGFGDGQLFVNLPEKTGILLCKKIHDGHANRIAQGFGVACQPNLPVCVFLFVHRNEISSQKYEHLDKCQYGLRFFFEKAFKTVPDKEEIEDRYSPLIQKNTF